MQVTNQDNQIHQLHISKRTENGEENWHRKIMETNYLEMGKGGLCQFTLNARD